MLLALIFVFGAIFGSFLNVLIYRLRNGGDIIFGRSLCPHCRTILKWFDLVPFLSFLCLSGRCRSCRKKISWQYPIVEFLSGLVWVAVFWKVFGFDFKPPLFSLLTKEGLGVVFNYIYFVFIFSSLLAVAVYDFKWKIIPDKIVYTSIAVAMVFNGFLSYRFWDFKNYFLIPFLIASIVFLFFYLIYFFSHGRAMGFGDAKLGFLLGLFLAPVQVYIAFNLAFIIGGLFGIILLVFRKKSLKSQIAFGPFLVVGAFLAFLFDFLIGNRFPF